MNGLEAIYNQDLNQIYQQKTIILKSIIDEFSADKLIPQIGIELEFYLLNPDQSPVSDSEKLNNFIKNLTQKTQNLNFIIEKEQGVSQIEAKTPVYSDIFALCEDLIFFKKTAVNLALELSLIANFEAQIFKEDCGSALQINFSLIDENENFLFAKNSDNSESQILLNSIGGILELTDQIMIFCAPKPEDYRRYDFDLNYQLFKKGKYTAPINICWGYNNRTAMIRIPENKANRRRIEFRLPAADADIYLTTACLLNCAKYGINNQINPPPALYGNAFDPQYQIKKLISDYEIAKKYACYPEFRKL